MKLILFLIAAILIAGPGYAQKPSKEQMEADRKKLAEAMKRLNEQTSKMSPAAKKSYDSALNLFGVGQKMNGAVQQVNGGDGVGAVAGAGAVTGARVAAGTGARVSTGAGAAAGLAASGLSAAALQAAKEKADEIHTALKAKRATADDMGTIATTLWMQGRSQVALSLMEQVCKDDAGNTDNLNNYAAMLTMTGSPKSAISILDKLNARFPKNSTILNNLGQAWFALGDMDKAGKYLDSTLRIAAAHPQANETKCLIDEGKGNKTAAVAHAQAAFKQGRTDTRANLLRQLGYTPGAADYNNFPPASKGEDVLNLGGFSMPPFPKSVAECRALEPVWKEFRAGLDSRSKPLQAVTDAASKATFKRLQDQQQRFMAARSRVIADPGSMLPSDALAIAGVPMFSEKMNAREKIVLENLQKKKAAVVQRISGFLNGDGAAMKQKYEDAMKKINEQWKEVGEGGTASIGEICIQSVKASDAFLGPYNSMLESLYTEYLVTEKQLLNEMAYSSLYTSYPEILPGINAGLQMQWLRDLSLTQNGFRFESVTKYECTDDADGKGGHLTVFKDPHCKINSDFGAQLGIVNFGFNMHLDCGGLTTSFNAGAIGLTLNQDLDHAGFGDSFKNCTVSVGPKASLGGKLGPLEASVSAGAGADVEIDRNGISDVVIKGGVEAEAGIGPISGSAGAEGRMSLNTGAGSLSGTGAFKK